MNSIFNQLALLIVSYASIHTAQYLCFNEYDAKSIFPFISRRERMHKYRASGRASLESILLLLTGAIVSGLILGGLLWAVEHFIGLYFVGLFPVLAGIFVGYILALIVRATKIRNSLITMLCGVVAAIVILSTYHLAVYYSFREQARLQLMSSGFTLTERGLVHRGAKKARDKVE